MQGGDDLDHVAADVDDGDVEGATTWSGLGLGLGLGLATTWHHGRPLKRGRAATSVRPQVPSEHVAPRGGAGLGLGLG